MDLQSEVIRDICLYINFPLASDCFIQALCLLTMKRFTLKHLLHENAITYSTLYVMYHVIYSGGANDH